MQNLFNIGVSYILYININILNCSILKSGPKKRCDGVDGRDAVSAAESSSQITMKRNKKYILIMPAVVYSIS